MVSDHGNSRVVPGQPAQLILDEEDVLEDHRQVLAGGFDPFLQFRMDLKWILGFLVLVEIALWEQNSDAKVLG